MKSFETRIEKWMKYREEILENQNIRKSLIHTNNEFNKQYKKISSIFHNIDFLENENNNFLSKIDSIDLNTQSQINEIDKKIENINNKERIRSQKNNEKNNYNSHKYDLFLKKYFANEYNDKNEIEVVNVVLGRKKYNEKN